MILSTLVNSKFYLIIPALIHLFYEEYFIVASYSIVFISNHFRQGHFINFLGLLAGLFIFISTLWIHNDISIRFAILIISYLMMEWSFYIDHIHRKFRKNQDIKWWGIWWVLLIMNASIRIKPSKIYWMSFIKGIFWGISCSTLLFYMPKIREFWQKHLHLTPFKKDIKENNY